jgi:hypothetical protein
MILLSHDRLSRLVRCIHSRVQETAPSHSTKRRPRDQTRGEMQPRIRPGIEAGSRPMSSYAAPTLIPSSFKDHGLRAPAGSDEGAAVEELACVSALGLPWN